MELDTSKTFAIILITLVVAFSSTVTNTESASVLQETPAPQEDIMQETTTTEKVQTSVFDATIIVPSLPPYEGLLREWSPLARETYYPNAPPYDTNTIVLSQVSFDAKINTCKKSFNKHSEELLIVLAENVVISESNHSLKTRDKESYCIDCLTYGAGRRNENHDNDIIFFRTASTRLIYEDEDTGEAFKVEVWLFCEISPENNVVKIYAYSEAGPLSYWA